MYFMMQNITKKLQKDLANGRQINICAYKACGPRQGHQEMKSKSNKKTNDQCGGQNSEIKFQ